MRVAGLLLAAGAGRRFGGPKALAVLDGQPLVSRGADLLRDGGCAPVVVVIGAEAEQVQRVVDAPLVHAQVVVAEDWADGLGASLRAGLAALADTDATACVVVLVDQPLVGVAAVRRLVAAAPGAEAAVATYGGEVGHPVLLSRAVWPEVARLAVGDSGARAWLRAHPTRVLAVPCDGTGSPRDVDTAQELSELT